MNVLITLTFLVFTIVCSAQSKHEANTIHVTLTARYRPANIIILKDHVQISTMEMNTAVLRSKAIKPGLYNFIIHDKQGQFESKDSVFVKKGDILEIELKAPCLYDRPADYVPFCPEKHTDNIIPIFYGLIIQVDDDSEVEIQEYHPGGCVITECDPKFYCKLHDKKF